jgi:hypothetical protein
MDGKVTSPTERRTPRALREHRKTAESFGSDPERYDRTRPAYPDALIEQIVADSPGLVASATALADSHGRTSERNGKR